MVQAYTPYSLQEYRFNMSLVVGRIVDNKISIISDSKVTNKDFAKNSPLIGVLKTLILDPQTSLSYTGKIYYIEIALDNYLQMKAKTVDDVLNMLLNVNIESNNETDFVLATIHNNIPKLYKISNGQIVRDISFFWIGDKKGYEIYQREFHTLGEKSDKIVENMRTAFSTVIESPQVDTIGYFQISMSTDFNICPNAHVFVYDLKIHFEVGPQNIEIHNKNEWVDVPMGSTENGSHGLSYLATVLKYTSWYSYSLYAW